jgi:hypothetical protein
MAKKLRENTTVSDQCSNEAVIASGTKIKNTLKYVEHNAYLHDEANDGSVSFPVLTGLPSKGALSLISDNCYI